MKFAMVGQFPPHIGGVGVHIHTLSKELIKQGHEVYVITYPHKDIKDIDGIHVIGTKGVKHRHNPRTLSASCRLGKCKGGKINKYKNLCNKPWIRHV